MNKKFFSITVLSLICFFSCTSCTNEEDYSIVQEGHTRLEVATFNVNVLDDIQKYVNYRMAESADTRSLQNICYEPYTIAGDTALYIVNYADGWDGTTSTGESANYIDESNGHIIGYKIKKQEIVTRTTYSYKMNWGWGGDNDNVVCNPYSINDWFVTMSDGQQYHFNSGRKMARQ